MDFGEAGVVEVTQPRHGFEHHFVDHAVNDDAVINMDADNLADDDVIGVVGSDMRQPDGLDVHAFQMDGAFFDAGRGNEGAGDGREAAEARSRR